MALVPRARRARQRTLVQLVRPEHLALPVSLRTLVRPARLAPLVTRALVAHRAQRAQLVRLGTLGTLAQAARTVPRAQLAQLAQRVRPVPAPRVRLDRVAAVAAAQGCLFPGSTIRERKLSPSLPTQHRRLCVLSAAAVALMSLILMVRLLLAEAAARILKSILLDLLRHTLFS